MSFFDHLSYLFEPFENKEVTKNVGKAFIFGGIALGAISFIEAYTETIDKKEAKLEGNFEHIPEKLSIYSELVHLQKYQFISRTFYEGIREILEIYNLLMTGTITSGAHVISCLSTISTKITRLAEMYKDYSIMIKDKEVDEYTDDLTKKAIMDWTYKGHATSTREIDEIRDALLIFNERYHKSV